MVPQYEGRGWQNEAPRGRPCLLLSTRVFRHVFVKKALPAATVPGGVQLSQRHPQHPAPCAGASCRCSTAACFAGFGESQFAARWHGTWSVRLGECRRPETTAQMSLSGESRAGGAAAAAHTASSRLQEGGWVPAAKQESKWKTVTYRKLCEARLVSEDYR